MKPQRPPKAILTTDRPEHPIKQFWVTLDPFDHQWRVEVRIPPLKLGEAPLQISCILQSEDGKPLSEKAISTWYPEDDIPVP